MTRSDGRQVRILFVDHCARMSGAEISMLNTISALKGPVTVVLGEAGPLGWHLEDVGARVVTMPIPSETATFSRNGVGLSLTAAKQAWNVIRYARGLAKEIRRHSPDVVVSNSMKGHVLVSTARLFGRFTVVFYLHDRIVPEFMSRSGVLLERTLIRVVPRGIIANSRSTMATAPRSVRQRVRAIAGGPIMAPAAELRTMTSERLRTDAANLVIGMVGRISPWKGQDVAIRAFGLAFPDGEEVLELVGAPLFGEEKYLETLTELIDSLGLADRVRFVGHIDDVYARMAGWQIFVHASTIPEPFGLVVAQAMALGLPVVAADAGGPAEMLRDGEDGLLVPPGDSRALADALVHLGADQALRLRLGDAAAGAIDDYLPNVVAVTLTDVALAAAGMSRPASLR